MIDMLTLNAVDWIEIIKEAMLLTKWIVSMVQTPKFDFIVMILKLISDWLKLSIWPVIVTVTYVLL
jgi:hypothetical protein